jgi:hypothetical protein
VALADLLTRPDRVLMDAHAWTLERARAPPNLDIGRDPGFADPLYAVLGTTVYCLVSSATGHMRLEILGLKTCVSAGRWWLLMSVLPILAAADACRKSSLAPPRLPRAGAGFGRFRLEIGREHSAHQAEVDPVFVRRRTGRCHKPRRDDGSVSSDGWKRKTVEKTASDRQ